MSFGGIGLRVIQIRTAIQYGDGMGNTMLLFDKILSKKYDTMIAVRSHSKELNEYDNLVKFDEVRELKIKRDDILLIHFGEKDELVEELLDYDGKRILVYQNVTYPFFFAGIDNCLFAKCAEGQRFVRSTVGNFLKAIAPSDFSYNELVEMGWEENDVYHLSLPVILRNSSITKSITRTERNFLFVGRIVPNKKIEDIIRVFDYYRKNYYSKSNLIIIGTVYNDSYYNSLQKYISRKRICNIEFLNHVSDEVLDRVYNESDIYLCMSEHEGFCIPLIEAMSYGIPVVAYNSTAVPDTMGDAGILLEKKDNKYVCERIDKLFNDLDYSLQLIEGQYRHLEKYIRNDCQDRLYSIIDEINSIESYEYDNDSWEFYRILLEEIDRNSKQRLLEQFKRISKKAPNIVIYGAGKVGTELIKLATELNVKFSAICDAGQYGKDLQGYTILSPQNCISQCKGAIYIITIQDKSIASQVADDLETMGVSKNNILYYSNTDKRIYI